MCDFAFLSTNIILPFTTNKSKQLQATQENPGLLELQCVKGGPVYLFKGALTLAECEAEIAGENANFDLAAAVGQNATTKIDGNTGTLTVYSPTAESVGFVRLIIKP